MLSRRQLIATAAALAAAPRAHAQGSETERLNAFFEEIYDRQIARSPGMQSGLGLKMRQGEWDDVSEARRLENAELTRGDLERLKGFDFEALEPEAKLSYRLFEADGRESLEMLRWRDHRYPVCQMRGPQRSIPQTLINNHPIADEKDAAAYIQRLNGVKPYLEQVVVGLRRQEAKGIKPPRFSYPLVIGNCQALITGAPFGEGPDCAMLADFKAKVVAARLPDQGEWVRRAETALQGGFKPGFEHLIAYLREAEATATDDAGVWKLPDGDAYYRAMLKSETTLDVSPDEVHAIGLKEVARIHGEMTALKDKTGFKGDLAAFFEFLKTDDRFYYPNTDQGRADYLAACEAVLAEINGRLGEIMNRKPKATMVVKRVEAWLEKSAATAGYFSPSADGTRPGIVYINLRDMRNLGKYEISALLYHEGVPGHHLENAISQELTGLPRFRTFGGYTAYSEGWGLYAEQLPKDIGLYQDPYQDFGRLSSELMRAGRLVADTGLHAKRWTREQTIAWLDANTPVTHADNVTATQRYAVTPGQACAYALGRMTMLRLRAKAQSELGARFDLRDFHDAVLGHGPVPMPILEENITAWIAEQQRA
ncbi:MAG TPA: DUF885 domain-containing protein [Phenylobacterium sp.]|nr:DUF885 domain-containing protein [Phenylobacterium sp.]